MANVGYSIFGRPEGQVNITNGLFQEAKLGGVMYLDGLTDGISLNKSESVAVIRQVTDNAGKSSGITIVSVFDYAESFGSTNRPGGFVGSGVCFKGFPHPSMIQKGLFSLHSAANKLVDSQSRKFLHADNSTWGIKLPAPNDAWSISVAGIKQSSEKNKSRLVVALDVPLRDQILSVVQGVLSNTTYNSYETVLIAQKGGFIDRAKDKGYKVISLFELLDYQSIHASLNKKFNETKAKATEQINAYSKKLDEVKITLQGLEQKIKQADERHDNIMGRLQQSEAAYKTSKTTAETEGKNLAQIQRDLSEANNNVKKGFDIFLKQNKSFNDEYVKRVRANSNHARQETKSNYSGKIMLEKDDWKALFVKSKFILVFSIVMLLIGFSISYFLFSPPSPKVIANDDTVSQEGKDIDKTTTTEVQIELVENDLNYIIDNRVHLNLVSTIMLISGDTTLKVLGTEIHAALEKVSNLDSLDNTVKEKIQLYNNSTYYLLPFAKDVVEINDYDFKTSKRMIILEKYLSMDGNVYKGLGFTIKTPLLMEHFIWMVEELSGYEEEKDKNLTKTNKEQHRVPIIKSE